MILLMCCILLFLLQINNSNCLKPNIIIFLTDDQDLLLNGLEPMKKTSRLIGNKGVIFENAFVNTPLCCPSRSTILTGKYPHNTGVRNNSISGNCSSYYWQKNQEPYTIPSILKNKKDYITFYAGKYLNQYGTKEAGGTKHVPKGYDWWIGLKGNSVYYNYTLSINGSSRYFGNNYLTDVLKEYSLSFLRQKIIANSPFFMMIAPPAPHQPFTPASRHKKSFPNARAIRTEAFNFSSEDKHWLLKMPPRNLPKNVTILDTFQKLRMQSLLAVDELVESVVLKLKKLNLLYKTYLIFTSDNGYHLGQFSQPYDKRQPYETDIRVPFMIRGPNIRKKVCVDHPIAAVDIAPTIFKMANIDTTTYQLDGTSFLWLIENKGSKRKVGGKRNNIFIEYFGESNENIHRSDCIYITDPNVSHCYNDAWCKCNDSRNNTYVCVRTISAIENFKFCRFLDDQNFAEAYDLRNDTNELYNVFNKMEKHAVDNYDRLLKRFVKCKGKECNV